MGGEFELRIDFDDIMRQAAAFDAAPEVVADEMMAAMQASLDVIEAEVVVRTPAVIGVLRGGIADEIHGDPPDFYGEVIAGGPGAIYGWPVERGRAAGRMPPLDNIEYWVKRKKLDWKDGQGQQMSSRRMAYIIAVAISRGQTRHQKKGGAKMFEEGLRSAGPHVERLWEGAVEAIAGRMTV